MPLRPSVQYGPGNLPRGLLNLQYADCKTQCASHERHDAVEGRKHYGDNKENDDGENTDGDLHTTPEGCRTTYQSRAVRHGLLVNASDDFKCRNDGPCVEGDFGQGDDSNEYAQQDVEGSGVAACLENVGGDFV